jgi:Peptidase family S41
MQRVLVLFLVLGAVPLQAQGLRPAEVSAWRADLRTLTQELPTRHPAPFLHITRAQWDSAVTSLDRRLPRLDRNQAFVGIMQLVALVGDAHTTVQPDPSLGLRYYPIELYSFEDGLFVRRADTAHAGLVGARVLKIGNASAEDALQRAGTIIPHENDWWVRAWGPFWLMVPEVLEGLRLTRDAEHLPLVLDLGGRIDTVILTPAGRMGHGDDQPPIEMRGWPSLRAVPPPAWEQHPGQPFWWTTLADSHTVYACLRAIVPGPQSGTNRQQWDQLFALVDSTANARLVIDLRENMGGNGGLNRYPVQQILRRAALDRPDRLFVIIGRRTFSAGQQFTNLLEAWTRATLVGEPTGQQPSQYGDHRPLVLPRSHLTVQISTVFHQAPNEFDQRRFVPPAIYAPLTSAEYRDGIDPALAAIMTPDSGPSMSEIVARAITAGDTAGAERAARAAMATTRNRFRSIEQEINALGYRLLGSGSPAQSVLAFQLNTRLYPESANTFDSLGEALLAAGRREEAIAAYRNAVRVEPGFPPSVQALQRMGEH